MLDSLLSSAQVNILQQALEASSLRQKVISNNIANVNTPGFKRSEVTFESRLQEALDDKKLPLVKTNKRHLPLSTDNGSVISVAEQNDTSMRTDGNNVDIDVEMANLAKNNIYYNAVAQQLGWYFSNLKSAINGGNK
ncbi:flagella basal body rod proteins signature [Lucifera butyrica]|uniref:Flagellar basal body rod protein FlgB n=1 Tax=Lucifera butyrica TaxID=1351585 RepID=A0A498RDG1_9FIRM|nr:flagellar basal body rod protein FlgB [Lucifera butyrica]VBB08103.1 flagella basal body rod proteins signature [Lucifera butyrica]